VNILESNADGRDLDRLLDLRVRILENSDDSHGLDGLEVDLRTILAGEVGVDPDLLAGKASEGHSDDHRRVPSAGDSQLTQPPLEEGCRRMRTKGMVGRGWWPMC